MRKLVWFTVGFTIACLIGVYFASGKWLLLLGLFCLLIVAVFWKLPTLLRNQLLSIFLGCALGLGWLFGFDWIYLRPVRQLNGTTQDIEIRAMDYSEPMTSGFRTEGRIFVAGKPYTVQFFTFDSGPFSPGDRIRGEFLLKYTGSGSRKPTYHQGTGIFLLCYSQGDCIATHEEASTRDLASVLRRNILTLVDMTFPADTAGFARALLLGDTTGLSFEMQDSLKTAGVYHIVAVSGTHVSILFALVYLLCFKRRVLVAVFGFPALLLFAGITGFSPSIVRACIMQALMILALLLNKDYDPPTALAASLLFILLGNPLSITSVSLQLSAGCVIGIFLFSQKIHGYLLTHTFLGPAKGKTLGARLSRWIVGSLSITLGAMLATTPLCALYFGCVSIAGVLSNLLILWIISLIFYGIVAACVLGLIWLPLGVTVGWLIAWLIRFVLWVTDMISKLPVAAVYTASIYIVAWLIFCYVMLFVFYILKKKRPFVLIACMLTGLIVAVGCSWAEPRQDCYRVTAVDVGQGQCILLQTDGKNYMVDCGSNSPDAAATSAIQLLHSQGIFRLDGLIITHYDTDHAGGADPLMSRIPTDALYLPLYEGENEIRDSLTGKFADRICWVESELYLDAANITIYPSDIRTDSNESSLCILFQPKNCDILITGDRTQAGERALLEQTDLPDLEILIAGHHGANTSTAFELLDKTRPEVVIISVGTENSYGHPGQEMLGRLELFGCKVYRTDLEGTIIFRG